MSATNRDAVELVRRAFTLYENGEFEVLFALAAPDIVFDPVYWPGTYEGCDSVLGLFEDDPRMRWRPATLDFEWCGAHVLVSGSFDTAGSLGHPVRLPIAWLFSVADGRITRVVSYINKRSALRALQT